MEVRVDTYLKKDTPSPLLFVSSLHEQSREVVAEVGTIDIDLFGVHLSALNLIKVPRKTHSRFDIEYSKRI